MDKSIKIANHNLNIGEILDVLQSNCPEYQEITKNGGEVVNFTTKALSENKGHVSMVYKLTLEFSNKKILNFALKVPTADPFIEAGTRIGQDFSSARRMIEAMICPFHVRECQFYRQVSPLFDSWLTPKVYDIQDWILDQKQGYLLLEDLTQNGIVLEKGATLNDEQIKSAVKFLVKFHVESWKTENEKSWKGKFLDGQKVWGDLIQQNSKELENLEDNFKNKVDSETMLKIQKYSNFLKPIITNKEFHYWAYQESHLESNIKEVLCHGDFW
uniref:Uncharacterized protein n=1 Tax=Panagrolaimus sp. JU765 TaxID=591449 RepID=A0AC34RPD6_9BILA